MLIQAGLIPLLITSTLGSPAPLAAEAHHKSNDGILASRKKDACGPKFKDEESVEKLKAVWDGVGAGKLLDDRLDKGLKDWTKDFFKDVVDEGDEPGTTVSCEVWSGTTCSRPNKCESYKPNQAYHIHMSLWVLYSQYNRIFHDNENDLIEGITGDISKIKDTFGTIEEDNSYLFPLITSAAIVGAAASGPLWMIGSPLVGLAGMLNMAAAVEDKNKPDEDELEDALEETLRKYYDSYKDTLESTFKAVFAGDFSKHDVEDPKKFIADMFSEGKFLSVSRANEATTQLIKNMKKTVRKGLIIQALKKGEYYVQMRTDVEEADCATTQKWVWMYDRCCAIVQGYRENETINFSRWDEITDEMFDSMTKDYDLGYKEAMHNAIQCVKSGGGSAPDMATIPPLDKKAGLPRCFVNLDAKEEDGEGLRGPPTDSFDNDFGYSPGKCNVHFEQESIDTDRNSYSIRLTFEDGSGKKFIEGDWQSVEPTGVIKGRESDKNAKLPFDFHFAAGLEKGGLDDDNIHFWYSKWYWITYESRCSVGAYDNYIRQGDCHFPCKELEHPPPSATADSRHPMPTEFPYRPGWCVFHVIQEMFKGDPPQYYVSLDLWDGFGNRAGYWNEKIFESKGTRHVLQGGTLPEKFRVAIDDDEMMHFGYGDQGWTAEEAVDHKCSLGGWDDDIRHGDCGFTC